MSRHRSRLAAFAALILIVVTNAITLALAAWNRVGGPEAHLQLEARDFEPTGYWTRHFGIDRGAELTLRWRVAGDPDAADPAPWRSGGGRADWLDDAKLADLGFPPPAETAPSGPPRHRSQNVRPAILVLEFDGPAYRAALDAARRHHATVLKQLAANPDADGSAERRKNADHRLHEMETASTRLYVVDAGLDEDALRARYPDRNHYALVHGRVAAAPDSTNEPERRRGEVDGVDIGTVHMPQPLRDRLAAHAARADADNAPQFSAPVAFGRRLEPWLVNLTP